MQLDELPDSITNLHYALPQRLKGGLVRLIKISAMRGWSSLKSYEGVDEAEEAVAKPYRALTEEDWAALLCVSWRWSAQKPAEPQTGFSPMSEQQHAYLQQVLQHAVDQGLQYAWIDWCCVPQYSESPLTEVIRSKVRVTTACI